MIYQLNWLPLPLEFRSIGDRLFQNSQQLMHQDGYTPSRRYAGLWSWPEQAQDAERLSSHLGFTVEPTRLHLQWVKPPGIGFHKDRNRTYSLVCSLTPDHPTVFRTKNSHSMFVLKQYHWAVFDHTVEHAVFNLRQDRLAVCVDFTGLYTNITEFVTAATAGSLRSCRQEAPRD